MNYGQIAYEAYREKSQGKSLYSGKSLPEWRLMDPNIQEAWEAAASAVAAAGSGNERSSDAHR